MVAPSVPWSSCSVLYPLDRLDGFPGEGLEADVRELVSGVPLPDGWFFSGLLRDGARWHAGFSVSGRLPSLLDGCRVARALVVLSLSSGPA